MFSKDLPTIVLDRDGVINYDSPYYIKSVDEFIFLPGSVEAIARLSKAGYRIGVATNQSGIARGYYTEETLHDIHKKLLFHVHEAGGSIDHIAYCKHMPDFGCECRKPNIGLLKTLANHFETTMNQMIFIGDKTTDIQAAHTAGARPILVFSSMTEPNILNLYPDLISFESLAAFADHLLGI